MDRMFFLAIAIVIAGFLNGGVYSMATGPNDGLMVVNRFTGSVWTCNQLSCAGPAPFKAISN